MSDLLCANPTCRTDAEPREVRDKARICWPCTNRLQRHLRDLAVLHDRLQRALVPFTTTRATKGASVPDLIRFDVADHRDEIRTWLATEVRMWHAELDLTGWPADDVHEMAAWLGLHVGRARHMEWVDTSAEAARQLRGRAHALADLPAERARIQLGPCPEHGVDDDLQPVPCSGLIWAHVPADSSTHKEHLLARCDTCTSEWDSTRWHRLGRRITAVKTARTG